MLKSWKFWVVMAALASLMGLFVFGFTRDPKHVPSPLVGHEAPPFTVTELNSGEPLSLVALHGTPVVLNFFASWCVACRDEAHVLQAAHERWGGDPKALRVIGIAVQDTAEAASRFAKRFGKTYYLALDNAEGDIALNYGLYGVPETFFVNADGTIRFKQIGAVTTELLNEIVPALMADAQKGN